VLEVVVQGFTDSTGSKQTNDKPSGERADAVTAAGVPRTRMTSEGVGESSPVADNATVNGRAKNRRVEVQIRPNDQLRQRAAAADKAAAG